MIQQFYFLEIHPKEMETLTIKDTGRLMFIAALFTIAKTWKQQKCPSVDEWVKSCGIQYNEILSSHKDQGQSLICNNMEIL